MKIPFAMGVGGTFDVAAGKVERAPVWMRNSGLEWFYRFLQEPRRMFKRYFIENMFFFLAATERTDPKEASNLSALIHNFYLLLTLKMIQLSQVLFVCDQKAASSRLS
jgi:hypothetical protein